MKQNLTDHYKEDQLHYQDDQSSSSKEHQQVSQRVVFSHDDDQRCNPQSWIAQLASIQDARIFFVRMLRTDSPGIGMTIWERDARGLIDIWSVGTPAWAHRST